MTYRDIFGSLSQLAAVVGAIYLLHLLAVALG